MKYIELCVVSEHSAKSLNFAHVYGRLCAPHLVSLVFPVGRLLEMRRFCQKDSFLSPRVLILIPLLLFVHSLPRLLLVHARKRYALCTSIPSCKKWALGRLSLSLPVCKQKGNFSFLSKFVF